MSELSLRDLGLAEQGDSLLPVEHVRALAATLDLSYDPAQPLPLLWHWAFFNPAVGTADLGPDGHPRRASALLADFPRRMWVGGSVRSEGPLHPDTATRRSTRLVKHAQKSGSSGSLLIVTLEHTVEQRGAVVVVETQDVIFREAGGVTPPEGPAVLLPEPAGWRTTFVPSTQLLFRFSAVTFNSHRIHYDAAYATGVEGYPGLVVQGPLTAMVLAGSAAEHLNRPLTSFTYRASNPLFVDRAVSIDGEFTPAAGESASEPTGGLGASVTATRADGAVAMTARALAKPGD